MSLHTVYPSIKEGIVAFVARHFEFAGNESQAFPPILGTGFVVRESGLIATNHHVIKAFKKIPKLPNTKDKDWSAAAFLLKWHKEGDLMGILELPLFIEGVFVVGAFDPGKVYYGPPKPDIAFVKVKATGLSPLSVDSSVEIREGLAVATAGFPMGRDALAAPGWIHQLTPTLQTGIVSAVMPFPCPTPHAFAINVMTQGGASGSPVFLPGDGRVIGILHAGLIDPLPVSQKAAIPLPTTISHVVPAHYITNSLDSIERDRATDLEPAPDTKSLEEIVESATLVDRFSDESAYEITPACGISEERLVRRSLDS